MVKMGTVWDRTAEFLSDNIAAVLPIALLAFFVPASIEGNFAAIEEGADRTMVVALYAIRVAFGILQMWGSLAIAALALDIASEKTAGRVALRRLLQALVVSVAMLAVVLVLFLPIPAVLGANGIDLTAVARGQRFDMSATLAGSVAIYLILLVLLLLWLGARLAVVTPVIVGENRWFGAIRRSWRLTRGATLRIVGVVLLYAIVSWVAALAAQTVFGSIFALVAGGEGSGLSLAGVLTAIVTAAVQTGFTVLAPVFTAKLYIALAAQAGFRQTASA